MTNEEIKKIFQNFKEASVKLATYETILNQMYDVDPDNTDLICEIDKHKSNSRFTMLSMQLSILRILRIM